MDHSCLHAVETSLLQNVHLEEKDFTYAPLVRYIPFFNSVICCEYEQMLSSDIFTSFLQFPELAYTTANDELFDLLEQSLLSHVQQFVSVDSDSDETVLRQLVVMFVGVSCLQLFVQNNLVGPLTSLDPVTLLPAYFHQHDQSKSLMEYVHRKLAVDDETVYQLSRYPLYLFLAKIFLLSCKELLSSCKSASLWQLRVVRTQQLLLEERSQKLKSTVLDVIASLSGKDVFSGAVENCCEVQMQFHIEAGHVCYFYYEAGMARDHFERAQKLSGLDIQLTGIMGKRTRFQQNDIAQLVLSVGKSEEKSTDERQLKSTSTEDRFLPKNVNLDDEAVLEKFKPRDPTELSAASLTATQQALILGLCHSYRKTHESDGQSGIVQEELMSFINCVLSQPVSWSVQTAALLLRCRWEKGNARRLQRSLAQLEELVNQFRRNEIPALVRLPLVYTVSLPPHWSIEQELGKLLDEIGAVSSALDVYLRLQAWDDVIACYAKLGHREKAEKLIREQLTKHETANLWCYLGDVTCNPEFYHKAWDVSNGRSSRAQRALAYYHFGKREVKISLPHFEKSLQVSPLQTGLWFTYGCAALESEEFTLAATAFRRCVNLESDNFAAWSNLATAYIKAANKPRAFLTYQEALKCDYENWRIWENFLAVAVDVGEFDEAIRAYHRLLELRNKHTDVPVLTVLVRVVSDNIMDAAGEPGSALRPKLLKLFGHVTAQVTSCADIWRLYAELLLTDKEADATTYERAAQFLRTAHSCANKAVDWEKDVAKCVEVAKLSHQLSQAYCLCLTNATDIDHVNRLKSSARLAVKGVVVKIRRQHTDSLTGQLNSDLVNAVEELEQDLLKFSEVAAVV